MAHRRSENLLHIVAADVADARQQFIDAMERDRADHALTAKAQDAEMHAEQWTKIAHALTAQAIQHGSEDANAAAMAKAAR